MVSQGEEHPRLASRIVCLHAHLLVYDYVTGLLLLVANPIRTSTGIQQQQRRTGGRSQLAAGFVGYGGSYIFIFPLHKRDCLQIHFILRQRKNRRTRIELLLLFLYCCCLPGSPWVDLFIGDHEVYFHRRRRSSLATTTCATLLALGCTTHSLHADCRPNKFTRTPR